jgi:drug/metabolite transporter (DMT)-like permease
MHINKNVSWFGAGFVFAILWASASTATKLGLSVAQPLVIAEVRFALASIIMLFISHIILKHGMPSKAQLIPITIYGLLNITIYLGLYVVAMQTVTAGIGALGVASNPVFISFFSIFLLRKKLRFSIIISLVVCTIGVVIASWPLLGDAKVSIQGLIILLLSMVSYSVGAIYFASRKWSGLSLLTINGWQTLIGGLLLLPLTLIFYNKNANQFNGNLFWLSVIWLAIPVSIVAVQLWLWLLKSNAVRAGLWLFLCPVFGFLIAAWIMNDEISVYTIVGVVLVVAGLLYQRFQRDE